MWKNVNLAKTSLGISLDKYQSNNPLIYHCLRFSHMKMNLAVIFLLLVIGDYSTSENTGLLYPYGASLDQKLVMKINVQSDEITATFTYFGNQYSSITVFSDGQISFDGGDLSPFSANIQISKTWNIFYRMSTDPGLISRNAKDLASYFPGINYTPKWVLVATWDKVTFGNSKTNKVNTFQAVLSSDENLTFIMYNYAQIEWIVASNFDGNADGVVKDGDPYPIAVAGVSDYVTNTDFQIPGSGTPAMINITTTSNVEVPGRWVFRLDQTQVIYPNLTSILGKTTSFSLRRDL